MLLEGSPLFIDSLAFFDVPMGKERVLTAVRHVVYLQVAVAALDLLVCIILRHFYSKRNADMAPMKASMLFARPYPGRWFMLHSLWNTVITIAAAPDFLVTVQNPADGCLGGYNLFPTMGSMALHLYHCIMPLWTNVRFTFQDFMHHFVFAIGGLGMVSVLWNWGPGANFAFVWLTGLPGAIDYFLLALVKMRVIDKLKEKAINAQINAWMRAPGCVIASAWMYSAWRAGKAEPPAIVVLLNVTLIFINGNYYSQRVISNEARCRTLSTGSDNDKGVKAS